MFIFMFCPLSVLLRVDMCLVAIIIIIIIIIKRFGFQSKRSTYIAIIELGDKINTAVEKTKQNKTKSKQLKKYIWTWKHLILLIIAYYYTN